MIKPVTKKIPLQQKSLLLGAHMSVEGGYYKAFERAASIGCTTLQIFTKSNRQWGSKAITEMDVKLFRQAQQATQIAPVVAHASYLINIGSPTKDIEQKSIAALSQELERCELLGIPYLVFHPGSRLGSTEDECLERIISNLSAILAQHKGTTMLLLENMAGQGSSVCSTFQQLATVRNRIIDNKAIGFCFDTCHAFAAGYDFRTPETYEKMWLEFDELLGLHNLKVIHINDSKKGLGSRVDRHEEIGQGKIGLNAFTFIFNDERLASVAKILETPRDTLDDYKKQIRIIYDALD